MRSVRAADEQAVDRYLGRLGLSDLRLRHRERSLAGLSGPARTASARQLAEAYVQQLLAAGEDSAKASDLERRVRELIEQAPEVNTPELKILLMQAEYQQVEAALLPWMRRETAEPPSAVTRTKLADLAARFTAEHQSLSADLEKISLALDEKTPAAQRATLEQQAAQKQSLASRAQFFVGWSNYYVGVTDLRSPDSVKSLTTAQNSFCDLLGVGPENDYADLEADSLGLESVWRSRAVIGLGLTECGLGRLTAAERCFGWLRQPSVPLALRDQGPYWHLQGLLNADKLDAAATLAERQIETFGPGESAGRTSFCVLLVRAGFVGGAGDSTTSRRLGELGILGLAKLRQFDALSTLMTRHKVTASSPLTRFYTTWLDARRKFTEAEKSKQQADYAAARDAFEDALALPEASSDLAVAGRCQLGLAWCLYRLEDLERAAKTFQQATPLLKAEAPDDALQSAWMEAVSLYQLVARQPGMMPQALAALETIQREYPKAAQAAKAQALIERLRPDLATPEQKAKRLAAIPAGDARYADAQFELCQLHHQRWTENRGSAKVAAEAAGEVASSARRFLQTTTPDGDHERRLRASLLALETLLADDSSGGSEIEFFLRSATDAAAELSPKHRSLPELHYRALQWAQRAKDQDAVAKEAEWIATSASGTPYELPALMLVAQQADRLMRDEESSLSREQSAAIEATGERTYGRLVELLGDSAEQIKTSKNALAANSRHAWYLERREQWPAAATRLEKLVAAFPSDRKYLRRAALAQTKANEPAAALEHWRKLLTGLKSGSDAWLEAKYYQIECLLATDRASARQVWNQFRLLYPTVESKTWGPKFAELENRFAGPS